VAIWVIFSDNSKALVNEASLDELIATGKILAFLRSSGWVRVGHDPTRSVSYRGPKRRKDERPPLSEPHADS
jgi:hypothetical protein